MDVIARQYGWAEKLSKLESGTQEYINLFQEAYNEIAEEITANACGEVHSNEAIVSVDVGAVAFASKEDARKYALDAIAVMT